MNDFNYDNEIIEISSDDTENSPKVEEVIANKPTAPQKNKNSLKEKWDDLSKVAKTGIIIGIIVVVLLIIAVCIYFIIFKNEKGPEVPTEEPVILEKDNYRYENGKLIFLDKNEREIGTYECIDKDAEKCYVAKLDFSSDEFDRVTSIKKTGEEIEKNSQIYIDNFVFIYDEAKISLYNMDKQESDLDLKTVKSYDTEKNLVVIEDTDSKYGLIEITSEGFEYLIRPSYDNLGILNSDLVLLLAQDKDDYYIINSEGKKLSEDIKANVMSANEEFIVAIKGNTYNLYSYDFEELLSDYDYISLHNNVIAFVKGNRLYLKNKNLDKLYEDGIRLENSNYVKKYVYDENNKLIETKKSYEIEVEDNIAIITIGENSKEVNLLEGEVSSKLSYISYFDGKLYFYSDDEKDDVLGTYDCINENNLISAESVLASCNLYSNDKGISGIYNNEYVFIYDNPKTENAKYYLYDIKEKKSKGTYSSIEIINQSEVNSSVKHLYTSASFIIAKAATGNNIGNYGILEINSEKVVGKVGFKYKSIQSKGDYYLLINIDNSYSIYNNAFTKISNEFSYIEIFDEYYVGITGNKLNVYKYDSVLGILENDVEVASNEFEIDFTNGFEIITNGNNYRYDKNGKEVVELPSTESEPSVEEGE
ncbi:MAG: hypothetical protein E7161_03450 [Firmicutes bacterium]|nr:hypothetical protein [Bacillota bacterium]